MKQLSLALSGSSGLTATVFELCYDHGHHIAALFSSAPGVQTLAHAQGVPGELADTDLVDFWVVIDDGGALPANASAPRLICQRRLPTVQAGTAQVAWHMVHDGRAACLEQASIVMEGGNAADWLAVCDARAAAMFRRLISRLAKGSSLDSLMEAGKPGALPLVDSAKSLHQASLWHQSNQTAREFITAKSLTAGFVSSVARAPQRRALVFAGHSLSYLELDQLSDTLACRLIESHHARGLSLGPGMRIGISLEKSLELYVAILAVLKTGAAYVPIDPGYPAERQGWMIEDAHISVVLCAEQTSLPAGIKAQPMMVNLSELLAEHAAPPPSAARADDLAVLIYTSGSTGRPKGVMLSHGNISHFCAWYISHTGLNADGVALQFSSVSFDASLLDMFPAWLVGGVVVAPSESVRRDFDALADLIRQHAVSHAFMPPAWLAGMPDENLPSLRQLITGGDVCDPDTIARWSVGRAFHNIYGPTECTVLATTVRFTPGSMPRCIGLPIANVRCHVLDQQGNPVGTGEEGELHIAGRGVGLGYLEQAEMNAARYVPDPLDAAASMYKTGDLVRWCEDGHLEFIGRIDSQIKVRGFRVELGEIENAILAAGCYRHAAVVATADKVIVAYLAGPLLPAEQALVVLRAQLEQSLPAYMLPAAYVEIEALPATHNGKIDRRELAARPVQFTSRHAILAPRTPLEAQLAGIWADILSLEARDIGVEDSFFELGGHSILVSRMLLAVKKTLSRDMALARFVENPTIASLASLLSNPDLAKGARIASRVYEDAVLPDDVAPLPTYNASIHQPERVLLTGANGFLGCFILEQLLQQTRAQVVCLVRGADDAQAHARLNSALISFGLLALIDHPRILVLAGDIGMPNLGVPESRFAELAATIDAIYHNGAHVNHLFDYSYLYQANVGSTLMLLRLACTGKNKSLHFVSTLSAASQVNANGELEESGPADVPPAFVNNGYNLTKWVSERLVWQAAQRGLSATIYRPGNITGHARTGTCQPDRNRILLLLKGSLQMEAMPVWPDMSFDLSPVDYLAQAIVGLSLVEQGEPVYHLHNPMPLTWKEYVNTLTQLGYRFEWIAPDAWRQRLLQLDEHNALFDVISFYLDEENEDIGDMSVIHWQRTARMLKQIGVDYPAKDHALLHAHFRYLMDCGFLPPVPQSAHPAHSAHDLSNSM